MSKALRFFVQSEPGQLNLQGINSNQSYLEVADPSTSGMNSTSNDNDWWNQKWNSIDDEEANNLYNTFRFWRVPLDVLDTIETEPEQDDIRNNLKMLDVSFKL